MTTQIRQQLCDANVRIEGMWPFPMLPAPEELAKIFEYADDLDDFPVPLRDLVKSLPDDLRDDLYDEHTAAFNDAFDELCARAFEAEICGWIGIAANPVFTPSGTGGASFSWGHYRTKVMFAKTAEQLLLDAVTWAEQRYESALTSAPAEGAAA